MHGTCLHNAEVILYCVHKRKVSHVLLASPQQAWTCVAGCQPIKKCRTGGEMNDGMSDNHIYKKQRKNSIFLAVTKHISVNIEKFVRTCCCEKTTCTDFLQLFPNDQGLLAWLSSSDIVPSRAAAAASRSASDEFKSMWA